MPFWNPRIRRYLLLDAAIVLALMGAFALMNHAFTSETPKTADTSAPLTVASIPSTVTKPSAAAVVKITPTHITAPQTIVARRTPVPVSVSKKEDVIDLARLRSRKAKVAVHTITMGENYWTIAKNNSIDVPSLIGANPTMPFMAHVKQELLILPSRGVLYTVQKGDDPAKIAETFGVTEELVKSENDVHWYKGLKEGDVVFVPGAKPILMTKEWKDYFSKRGLFGDPLGRWAKINSPYSTRTDPITGEERHHNGVDLKAKYGDPVYAAGSGRISFTGVSGGYGNLIVLSSGGGYTTYYGHLSKIYAKQGQKVRRGTLIGRVGATGRVTGPHLHFEIRKNNKPLDPLLYI